MVTRRTVACLALVAPGAALGLFLAAIGVESLWVVIACSVVLGVAGAAVITRTIMEDER